MWGASTARFMSEIFGAGARLFRTNGGFVPAAEEDFQKLLDASLLEKAMYELTYELNNRPTWIRIPLAGVLILAT